MPTLHSTEIGILHCFSTNLHQLAMISESSQIQQKLANGGALANCPLYKKLASCPVLKQMTRSKPEGGKCVFAEYIKTVQPSGGLNSKCPFYELFSKCPLYQRIKTVSCSEKNSSFDLNLTFFRMSAFSWRGWTLPDLQRFSSCK